MSQELIMDEELIKKLEKRYDWVDDFIDEGFIGVELNGKWGLVNNKGEEVIKPIYNDIYTFDNKGFCPVKVNGKWGFIDKEGKEVTKPIYDDVYIAIWSTASINHKWGLIDKSGKKISPFKYDNIEANYKEFAGVVINGKWGLIDKEGKELVIPKYDDIYLIKDRYIVGRLNNSICPIDLNNFEKVVNTNHIDNIGSRKDTLYYTKCKDTYIFKTGCFIGDLNQFKEAVIEAHKNEKDMKYYNEYMEVINKLEKEL